MLFAIVVGTGIQILAMVFMFMLFVLMGIITPHKRGALITALYFFFIMLSNISGYYSARIYKMFQGSDWLLCTMLTSMVFPCFVFIISLIINFAKWLEQSSSTISFPTFIVLILLYCFFSVPNVWLGSFIGFKKSTIKNPGKINKLSREIPKQPLRMRSKIWIPIGGAVIFA